VAAVDDEDGDDGELCGISMILEEMGFFFCEKC
jgi:hypothetical protein